MQKTTSTELNVFIKVIQTMFLYYGKNNEKIWSLIKACTKICTET